MRSQGESYQPRCVHSAGCHDICTLRKTRSGCGIRMVKRPSTVVSPVITAGVIGHQLRLSAYQGKERQEVLLEPTLISEHFPFLRQGILAGLGVGLVPDYVVQAEVASGEVLLALQEYRLSIFGSHMYLMYLPGRHQTRAVRTCIDFLMAKAGHGASPVLTQ